MSARASSGSFDPAAAQAAFGKAIMQAHVSSAVEYRVAADGQRRDTTVVFVRSGAEITCEEDAVLIRLGEQVQSLRWSEFPVAEYARPDISFLQRALYSDRESVVDARLTPGSGPWAVVRAPGAMVIALVDAIMAGYTAAAGRSASAELSDA